MAKKDSKKFELTDVGWPGMEGRAKVLVGKLATKSYRFDLPIQHQQNISKPTGVLNPWGVWRSGDTV